MAQFVDFDNLIETCQEVFDPDVIMDSVLGCDNGDQKVSEGTNSLDSSILSIDGIEEAKVQLDRLRKFTNKIEPGSDVLQQALQHLSSAKNILVAYGSE